MKITLAPMHGLADYVMRETLTQIGGFDECVSEFVRITHTVHSQQIWYKHIPELNNQTKTVAGVPCTIQLLGSDLHTMAENAFNVAKLGARKIDLNFGCPAPNVNNHKGGAVLLKEPEQIFKIVQAVRHILPNQVILSAKMRLGYEDTHLAIECAQAIESGGASILTVHARTKLEAYQPPAHWHWIKNIKEAINIPIVANGDIFTLQDYIKIKDQTNCEHIMIGRGALMRPDLAKQIKQHEQGECVTEASWHEVKYYISQFFMLCQQHAPNGKYPMARLKQWLGMLQKTYPQAQELFAKIRTLQDNQSIHTILND